LRAELDGRKQENETDDDDPWDPSSREHAETLPTEHSCGNSDLGPMTASANALCRGRPIAMRTLIG
jgi:hypothetical protein